MFTLPRRKREAYDENRTQIRHLTEMENRIMSALEDAVAELQSAISNANSRFQNVGELETALATERAKYDELVSAEAAEDVQQEAELAEARAATDAALAEAQNAAQVLSGLADQVNELGTVVAEQPSAEPLPPQDPDTAQPEPAVPAEDGATDEAPVDTPADSSGVVIPEVPNADTTTSVSDVDVQAETPARDVSDQAAATEATGTQQNGSDAPVAAVDQVPPPANAAPVPATGGETPAATTGPTDADGNPVDAPSV